MYKRKNLKAKFVKLGGSWHLKIQKASDLSAIETLPEPFWMALSAPTDQPVCDPVLLARLDTQNTGRIHSNEIRSAVRKLLRVLNNYENIDARSDALHLNMLHTQSDEGCRLHAAARRVLENLGAPTETLSLSQVRNRTQILNKGDANGDGVIPPDCIDDPDLKQFACDIAETIGTVEDASGTPGVDRNGMETFLLEARNLLAWCETATTDHHSQADKLLPFGADTPARFALFLEVEPLLDRYFTLCRAVYLQELLGDKAPSLVMGEVSYHEDSSLDAVSSFLESSPIARPQADCVLRPDVGLNPHYSDLIYMFMNSIARHVLDTSNEPNELTLGQWTSIRAAFVPYRHFLSQKTGGKVESLGIDTVKRYIEGDYAERLGQLISTDLSAGITPEVLDELEFIILMQRWVIDLCSSFVSFIQLYDPKEHSLFEMGTLVIDGRMFHLNMRVREPEAHSTYSIQSGLCLLYLEVSGRKGETPFYIVTPVTRGSADRLIIGKRGALFDNTGKEWDARVVRIVQNPISLGEAIRAPFRRISELLSATAEKLTTGTEEQLQGRVTEAASTLQTGIQEGIATPKPVSQEVIPAPPAPPSSPASATRARDTALALGAMAAGLGAVGSSFTYIVKSIHQADIQWWQVIAAIVVGLIIILAPTTILAILKLRKQDVSVVLEAAGWCINGRMRLNRSLRRALVTAPAHPSSIRKAALDITHMMMVKENKGDQKENT